MQDPTRQDPDRPTLIRNVRIFDGTTPTCYEGEVEILGDRIVQVARGVGQLPSEHRRVIDGKGQTLMPGLVNSHGHLSYPAVTTLEEIGRMPVEENMMEASYNARIALDHGFTAVVSGAAAKPRLDIVLRDEINAGRIPGPRLQAASPEMTVSGGLADGARWGREIPANGLVGRSPDEFRQLVRAMIREGVDLIKFNNSGDSFCYPLAGSLTNPMTEDEVRAICDTTNNLQRRLAAHAHADSSVEQCIRFGVEFIYHATFITEQTVERLEKVKDRHFVTPAFGLRYNIHYESAAYGIDEAESIRIGNKNEVDWTITNVTRLRQAGIRVLPFGDYGFKMIPLGTDARDLQHFVNYFGYQPWEALRAATAWGGEAWKLDKLGQVKADYLADLLLVDGDPLADLSLLLDTRRLTMIMKGGAFHKAPAG